MNVKNTMSDNSPVKKLSLTEAVIAHLLRESTEPLFGLELVRRSSSGKLKLKKGTIYVTLERMEKKELVSSERETSPPPHVQEGDFYIPRRLYTLTPRGLRALEILEEAIAQIPGFLVRS